MGKDVKGRISYGDMYANELRNYGGIPTRRIDIIRDLQKQGSNNREIDAYLFGLDTSHEKNMAREESKLRKEETK